jgi:hypothetical protein
VPDPLEVLLKLTGKGEQPVVVEVAVNVGLGEGRMVICCVVFDEHPADVFAVANVTV